MSPKRIFVISDIHVGAGELDDCDLELETHLVEFLVNTAADEPTELVINGDFLDFAQAEPWAGKELRAESASGVPLCFTEQQSLAKLDNIYKAHAGIFEALRRFLERNVDNMLVILPGNHDVDFFWLSVRERFLALMSASPTVKERTKFHLEQVYRPTHSPSVWIEHGHQYDRCNRFYLEDESPRWSAESPPIFLDKSGEHRLMECVGTRFLIRFLNRLDRDYPYVDNVKPFSRFISIFGMSALSPRTGSWSAATAIWAMLRFLTATAFSTRSDLLTYERENGEEPEHPLKGFVDQLTKEHRLDFQDALAEAGFELSGPLSMAASQDESADACMEFLADNMHLLDRFTETDDGLLSIDGGDGTLSLAKGFLNDESQTLVESAESILEADDVDLVIMGHTHEIRRRPDGLAYYNSGCWTRYYEFETGDRTPSWSELQAGAADHFPYGMNYVSIPTGDVRQADLKLFAGTKKA